MSQDDARTRLRSTGPLESRAGSAAEAPDPAAATRLHASPAAAPAPVPASGPAPATRLRGAGPPPSVSGELQQATVIRDRYRLEELIGQGGMGQVWRAKDLLLEQARDPRPYVALKLLNRDFETHPDAFVTLQREAGKAQQLAHPNIATVFSFDRDDRSGRAFLTMELLEGRSLEVLIDQHHGRGIGRRAALPIIRGVAEGLSYAHRKGIVHSDLKPANIFLLTDGTPKILDFGIARAVPTGIDTRPVDSFDAGALGAYTEPYATAEMIGGEAPAPADDLYSLAVIACELLDGRHPFEGRSAVAAEAAHARPPALRELRRPEQRAILSSLSFTRSARPRDAAEFLRIFSSARPVRNALLAAIGLLAVACAYLWYSNYRQQGPAIAFEQLPPAAQQQIRQDLSDGRKFLDFYERQHQQDGLEGALESFDDAYRLQRGNREAAAGMRRVAGDALDSAKDAEERRQIATMALQHYEYLRSYAPVRCALGRDCSLADRAWIDAQRLARRLGRLL